VIGFFIFPFSKKTKRSGKPKNLIRKKIGKNGRKTRQQNFSNNEINKKQFEKTNVERTNAQKLTGILETFLL